MTIYVIYKVENHRDREVEIVSAHVDRDVADQRAKDLENGSLNRGMTGYKRYFFHVEATELEGSL